MQPSGFRSGRSAPNSRDGQPQQSSSKWIIVLVATSFVLGLYFGSSTHVFKPVLESNRLQSSTQLDRGHAGAGIRSIASQNDHNGLSLPANAENGGHDELQQQASGGFTLAPSPSSAPASASVPAPSSSSTGTTSLQPASRTPVPTPTISDTGTPTPSHTQPPRPSKAKAPAVTDYRATQMKATPFPATYLSTLSKVAQEMGVEVPDILQRARQDNAVAQPCPPHSRGAAALAGTVGYDEHGMGGPVPVVPTDGFTTPQGKDLARFTLGLAVQSHNSPATLVNTLHSHAKAGLLDLVDEKVIFLSAPVQEEIDLALSYGFRVYTPDHKETVHVKARNMDFLQQFNRTDLQDQWNAFPHARNIETDGSKPPRWASLVAPSQAVMYMEMASDVILFAERDYVLPVDMPRAQLIRSLLTGVALVATGTSAVRLRRVDDPNREVLTNCCEHECDGRFSNFNLKCSWDSHLDWLTYFCDRDNIEERSKGQMKACMNEWQGVTAATGVSRPPLSHRATVPADSTLPVLTQAHLALNLSSPGGALVEPLSVYCFSSDSSGWSNNVAMFGRRWWLETLGHIAILSGPDNGEFEVNAHLWCGFASAHSLGAGPNLNESPFVCQLDPGLFFHVELDK